MLHLMQVLLSGNTFSSPFWWEVTVLWPGGKAWPAAGCVLWGAVCLEVKYCTVVSPLSLCECVPKYLCHLKMQTVHQIITVPQQLSVFLEDLDQRPKNKVVMEVQISLLGCKTESRWDWGCQLDFLGQGLCCGEMGWWPHCDAFHLPISARVHLWSKSPAWILLWQPECKQALLVCVPQGCQAPPGKSDCLTASPWLCHNVAQVERSKVNK